MLRKPVLATTGITLALGLPLIALSSAIAFDSPFADAPLTDLDTAGYGFSPETGPLVRVAIWAAVRLLFLALLWLAVTGAAAFVRRLRAGDPVYRRWLVVAAGLIAVNTVILVLTWPGYWAYDEYSVLADVQQNWLPTWQHIFSSIYYAVSLTLIPVPSGILIVQFVLGSFAAGYVVARSWSLFARPKLAYLLVVPFLLLPVLLFNQYPLRVTMFAYLELAVLFRILVIHLRKDLVTDRHREFLLLSAGLSVAAFWRTEALLSLVLLPVLAVTLGVFKPREAGVRVRRVAATVAAAAVVLLGVAGLSTVSANAKYPITAVLNPLSVMLQQPLGGPNVDRNLAALDRVLDLDVVRGLPSAYEIPSFWTGEAVREDYREHLRDFELAYASLVLENPGAFLEARLTTFLATNSLGDVPPAAAQGYGFLTDSGRHFFSAFEQRNPSGVPLDEGLRKATVRVLLWTPLWNVVPVLAAVLVALVVALVRRSWLIALLFGLLLARAVITFATAPADYFMYYFSVYLLGIVFVLFLGLRRIAGRPGRRSSPALP